MVTVTDVALTPVLAGKKVHVNITGDLPIDITARLNPTIDVNAYFGTWYVLLFLTPIFVELVQFNVFKDACSFPCFHANRLASHVIDFLLLQHQDILGGGGS